MIITGGLGSSLVITEGFGASGAEVIPGYLEFLYDLIHGALPLYDIVRAGQSNTIYDNDFISYDVVLLDLSPFDHITNSNLHKDSYGPLIGTFDRTFQQKCPLHIQLKGYSKTAPIDLQSVVSYMRSFDGLSILDRSYVSLIRNNETINAPYLGDNTFMYCTLLEIEFLKSFTRTEALLAILETNVSGSVT